MMIAQVDRTLAREDLSFADYLLEVSGCLRIRQPTLDATNCHLLLGAPILGSATDLWRYHHCDSGYF